MSPAESLLICRYVKAACPQQKMDEYTPDAWHDLLSDLVFDQAMDAVKALCRRQIFVAPSEIRSETKAQRSDRIDRFNYVIPPDLPDEDAGYAQIAHQRMVNRLAGDGLLAPGDLTPTFSELRPVIEADRAHESESNRAAASVRRAALTARLTASLVIGQ